MNKYICIFALILLSIYALSAQDKDKARIWDIDKDGKPDYAVLDTTQMKIVCKLSTHNYIPIESMVIENYENQDYILLDDSGFGYYNNWMRAGYACYFGYDENKKRIRLVTMTRYEFGNAANDGSGESSINLLTGEYTGNWNYADYETLELFNIPAINTHMEFPEIYLEDFSDETYFDYGEKCAELYHKYKKIHQENRK